MISPLIQPRLPHMRGGYTLLELLLGVMILAMLMLAMQSAALIATRAIPNGSSLPATTQAAARGIDQLAADLTFATSITRSTAREIEFTVSDRNGDGTDETLLYCWSGTPGDALIRRINGIASVLVGGVQDFQLAYDTRTVPLPPASSESSESKLMSYNPSFAIFGSQSINSSAWLGQYFKPRLPSNATAWRITEVVFKARARGAATGSTMVQIRTASNGKPTNTVLEQVRLPEANLSDWYYTWQHIRFSDVGGLSPSSGVCLVWQWESGLDSCDIRYASLSWSLTGINTVLSKDGGSSWSSMPKQVVPFYVYGTVTTPDAVVYQYRLMSVRCSLYAGSNAQARVTSSVRVLNEPEVPGP